MSTKIDMHTHTRSSDGTGTPSEIARAALVAGLDGICLTDHNITYATENLEVAKACRAEGLRVFHGCEYSSSDGHILVYGVDINDLGLGMYAPMQRVIHEAGAHGGVAIPSHPFHGHKYTLGDGVFKMRGLVALETMNGQNQVGRKQCDMHALAAAKDMKIKSVGGSDAHFPANTGCVYTEFEQDIVTARELVWALTHGWYNAVKNPRLDNTKSGSYPGRSVWNALTSPTVARRR